MHFAALDFPPSSGGPVVLADQPADGGPAASGAKASQPKKTETATKDALTRDSPALVDIDVDPNQPPLPGKVARDHAK
jgi:hypothetical protein